MDPVDPKLNDAAEDIKAVLRKHDIAGFIMLSSGERAEIINHIFQGKKNIGPSWSCIYLENGGIRIRAKGHAGRYRINLTVKMLHIIRDLLAMHFCTFNDICKMFGQHRGERTSDKLIELIEVVGNE